MTCHDLIGFKLFYQYATSIAYCCKFNVNLFELFCRLNFTSADKVDFAFLNMYIISITQMYRFG